MALSEKEAPPIYLPNGSKFILMYKDYFQSRKELGLHPVSLSTFRDVWKKYLPHIKIQTRRTDMCNTCDFLVNELARGERGNEAKNEAMIMDLNAHCDWANSSRDFYNENRAEVLQKWIKYGIKEGDKFPDEATDSVRMIAYDFAQLSMDPHNTDQRGSIYFKVFYLVSTVSECIFIWCLFCLQVPLKVRRVKSLIRLKAGWLKCLSNPGFIRIYPRRLDN